MSSNTPARITWLDCFDPNEDTNKNVFQGLNALARVDYQTGGVEYFSPGPNCLVQEPAFSPRHPGAPEGDGFLITLIDNMNTGRNELVSDSSINYAALGSGYSYARHSSYRILATSRRLLQRSFYHSVSCYWSKFQGWTIDH